MICDPSNSIRVTEAGFFNFTAKVDGKNRKIVNVKNEAEALDMAKRCFPNAAEIVIVKKHK